MEIKDARINWNIVKAPPTPIAPGVSAPSAFTAHLDIEGGAKVTMEVEVIDKVPRCVEVVVRSDDLGGRDLRLPILRWLDSVVASVAMTSTTSGGVTTNHPPSGDQVEHVVDATQASTRRRRHVTDDVLERTATAYRQGQAEAVMAVLNVSEATAYRYIRRAREAGVLEQRES